MALEEILSREDVPADVREALRRHLSGPLAHGARGAGENDLADDEALLRAIIGNAPLMMIVVDADRRVRSVNGAAVRALGAPEEALIGQVGGAALRCLHHLDHPDGCGYGPRCQTCPVRNAVLQTLASGAAYDLAIASLPTIDGQERFLSFVAAPLRFQNQPMALLCVQDVTERVVGERALRASEERYRRITDAITDYIYHVRIDAGRAAETHHGEACEAVTGYRSEDYAADPFLWYRMVLPEDRGLVEEQARRALAGEDVPPLEHRLVRKDGALRWVRNTIVMHRDQDGRLLAYDGLVADVTEPKWAEAALRASEERYRQLFETESDALFLIDDETGRILEANGAATEAYGYSHEELLSLRNTDVSAEPDATRQATTTTSGRVQIPVRWHRRKDGMVFPVEITARHLELGGRRVHLAATRDISSRFRAEEALRVSEAALRRSQEVAHVGHWIWDTRQNTVTWSDEMYRIFGIPRATMGAPLDLSDVVQRSIHPEDAARVAEANRRVLEERRPAETEYRVVWPDGSVRHVWAMPGDMVTDEKGDIVLLSGIVQDVTERKRAEEAARQEGAFSGLVIAKATEGLCVCHGIPEYPFVAFTIWNDRMTQISGYTMAEINRLGWYQSMYPDPEVQRRAIERMTRMRLGDDIVAEEWTVTRADGAQRTLSISTAVFVAGDGGSHVLALMQDVTESKLAERDLKESEQRYRLLVDNAEFPVVVTALTDGRLLFLNQRAEAFFAVPPGETGNVRIEELWVDAEDWRQVLAALSRHDTVTSHECQMKSASGPARWALVSANVIEYAGERAAFFVCNDITEIKRAESERIELERRLLHTQKLESLGILAGGIAHDFNNLLMAILGNLDLSLLHLPASAPARRTVEQAMQAARRATDLTRQMLAYSGRGRFVIQRIDLSELVRENAELLRSSVPRHVRVDLLLVPEGGVIEADAGQVEQVVINLITNAAEALGETTGTIRLATGRVRCEEGYLSKSRLAEKAPPGEFVYLEVADDGSGMSADTLQRLFDPFFTTKFTGRGLGLSAVLGIVRGHKGAIMVDSAPGRGTTMRVLFPAASAGAAAPTAEAPATSRPAPEGTILVVDDEDAVRALCVEYVQMLGFPALGAPDGETALRLFEARGDEIVCVLLDLTMPHMDGVSTFREMRRLRPDVNVVLCSGYDEQEATQRFALDGLRGFLQKPYLLQELERGIAQALRRSAE